MPPTQKFDLLKDVKEAQTFSLILQCLMVFIHSLFFFYTLLFVMGIYRFNRNCSSLDQFVLMVYMIVLIMKMETLFCLLCLKVCNRL